MRNYEKIVLQARNSLIKTQNFYDYKDKSDSNLMRIKNRLKIPCSIKPVSCVIPRDLNLKEIFIQLFNSAFLLYDNNKIYMKLTQEQIAKRKYIIESIKKFIIVHRIKYKILYNIIYLLDILICNNNKTKLISSFEKLGLGSAILMIKFLNNECMMVPLNKFKGIFEKKNYTINQLQEIEILSLKLINYYMNFPTPISFMELLLLNGVVFSTDNIKNEISHKIYNMILITLEKIMVSSNEYVKYNPLYLCCCVVAFCRNYYCIEKWPKILSRVFDVNQKYFDSIYKEFFSSYNSHYDKKAIFNDIIINNKYNDNESNLKNKRTKRNNDMNINYINKDIKTTQENKENKDIKEININNNILNVNNKGLNINLNFKMSQELRNSTFFRKINDKCFKHMIRNTNITDNLNVIKQNNLSNTLNNNSNVNTINEANAFLNESNKNENNINSNNNLNKINNDLIQFKYHRSIVSSKKPLTALYKTPIKFNNDKDNSCFFKRIKKSMEYSSHHINISNISLLQKNNNKEFELNKKILYSREINLNKFDESNITDITNKLNNNIETNTSTNNYNDNKNRNNKSISLIKKEETDFYKKLNNKTIDNISSKINLREKDEIKVRVREIFMKNNNNDIQKQRKFYLNKFISTENNLVKNKNNKNSKSFSIIKINEDNDSNNSRINENNNGSFIRIIEKYKKNLITKNNIHNSMTISDNNKSDNNILNIPINKDYHFFNEIKTNNENNKPNKIAINRHSSCNDKYNRKINYGNNNKEEDYSNQNTSENSHNFSIRRNYFRLRKLRDRSTNLNNNENTTITVRNNNNLIKNNKANTKSSIYLIKSNIEEREKEKDNKNSFNINKNINGMKSTKFKDCLKIGFGSIERRNKIKNNLKEKEKEKSNDKEINKSINHFKRYSDIRNFYKLKNRNKNKNIGEMN